MNNQQYFQTTSLSCRLKAAQRELDAFRSGEAYVKLHKDYENIIRSMNTEIKKLQHECDAFSFSRKEITRQWMDVLEDVQKEQEKEVKKLKKLSLNCWISSQALKIEMLNWMRKEKNHSLRTSYNVQRPILFVYRICIYNYF